jgi:hypothetical protein
MSRANEIRRVLDGIELKGKALSPNNESLANNASTNKAKTI